MRLRETMISKNARVSSCHYDSQVVGDTNHPSQQHVHPSRSAASMCSHPCYLSSYSRSPRPHPPVGHSLASDSLLVSSSSRLSGTDHTPRTRTRGWALAALAAGRFHKPALPLRLWRSWYEVLLHSDERLSMRKLSGVGGGWGRSSCTGPGVTWSLL